MQVLGNWLDGSGWTSALVQADIASAGTADSFINVSHVRHAHQVTAACIHILLHRAYCEYKSDIANETDCLSLEQWCELRAQQSVQFFIGLKLNHLKSPCYCLLDLFAKVTFSCTRNP